MPSKKKKYNARFPPARIKKIMQTDEEVGKVAAAVPVIISRALELFIDSLIEKTASVTRAKNAKTLSSSHVKQAIHSEKTFDFLRELVKNVPDHQTEEEMDTAASSSTTTTEKKPKVQRPKKPKEEGSRGRGRPRKVKVEEKKESASEVSDEETETDEEVTADEDSQQQNAPNQSQAQCTSQLPPPDNPQMLQQGPSGQMFQQGQIGHMLSREQSGQMLPQEQIGQMLPQGQTSAQMFQKGQGSSQMLYQGMLNAPAGHKGPYGSDMSPQAPYSGENFSGGSSMSHDPQQGSMMNKPHSQASRLSSCQSPSRPESQVQPPPGIPDKQGEVTRLPYPVHSQNQHRMPRGFNPSPSNMSMHNMGYPQYPFMSGGQPMPYIHPQSTVGGVPPGSTNPGLQSAGSIPPQFIPGHPAYMMPQMPQNGPMHHVGPPGMSVGPPGMSGIPVGPPPPLIPISTLKNNRDPDGDAPLDMSLAGKSRSQTSTVTPSPPPLSQIPTPVGMTPNPTSVGMTPNPGYMIPPHEVPPVPYPQGFPQWRMNTQINQNIQETGYRSQISGPPPLVSTTVTQSTVTENGKHKQNDLAENIAKKSKQKKVAENEGAEKIVSFPGLANIMNMKTVKSAESDADDDYDT